MRKTFISSVAGLVSTLIIGTSVFAVTQSALDEYELPIIPVDPTPTVTETQFPPVMYDGANIYYGLENVISSNTSKSVWSEYQTVLSPRSGYKITSIDVTYGGQAVEAIDNGDGTYSIFIQVDNRRDPVINVNAAAVLDEDSTFTNTMPYCEEASIAYELENVISSNMAETVKADTRYRTVLSPKDGYKITEVNVKYGERNIVPFKFNDGTYDVTIDVNRDTLPNIVITAKAELISTTIPVPDTTQLISSTVPTETTQTIPQVTTTPSTVPKTPKLSKTKLSLVSGKTYTLRISNGKVKKWMLAKSGIVNVLNGRITALCKGSVKLTAVLTTGKKLTCSITVTNSPKLSKSSISVKKGKTAAVRIVGKASAIDNKYTNTKYAKIISTKKSSTIKIKGLKKGTSYLKIKVNGVKLFKLKVTVK